MRASEFFAEHDITATAVHVGDHWTFREARPGRSQHMTERRSWALHLRWNGGRGDRVLVLTHETGTGAVVGEDTVDWDRELPKIVSDAEDGGDSFDEWLTGRGNPAYTPREAHTIWVSLVRLRHQIDGWLAAGRMRHDFYRIEA